MKPLNYKFSTLSSTQYLQKIALCILTMKSTWNQIEIKHENIKTGSIFIRPLLYFIACIIDIYLHCKYCRHIFFITCPIDIYLYFKYCGYIFFIAYVVDIYSCVCSVDIYIFFITDNAVTLSCLPRCTNSTRRYQENWWSMEGNEEWN